MSIVHGATSTNKIVPLLLDASGNVIVSASQLTTTGGKLHVDANGDIIPDMDSVTTTGGKIKLDSSGRTIIDGESPSLLRPEPKAAQFSNLTLPAGTSTQTVFTVPANQAYKLSAISYMYTGTVAGLTIANAIYTVAAYLYFEVRTPIVNGAWYLTLFNALIQSGYSLVCQVIGATLNDDIYVNYFAERVY